MFEFLVRILTGLFLIPLRRKKTKSEASVENSHSLRLDHSLSLPGLAKSNADACLGALLALVSIYLGRMYANYIDVRLGVLIPIFFILVIFEKIFHQDEILSFLAFVLKYSLNPLFTSLHSRS